VTRTLLLLRDVGGAFTLHRLRRMVADMEQRPGVFASRAPGMSRYQNSGSQSAAGTRRPRRGGRVGAPVWSAAWTAAATSRAVSASMTMFRRSSMRRTTCPACGGASCGPMTGSVTPGTVEETNLARLPDTPDLQRLLQRSPGGSRPVRGPAGDHVANRFSAGRLTADTATAPLFRVRPAAGRYGAFRTCWRAVTRSPGPGAIQSDPAAHRPLATRFGGSSPRVRVGGTTVARSCAGRTW